MPAVFFKLGVFPEGVLDFLDFLFQVLNVTGELVIFLLKFQSLFFLLQCFLAKLFDLKAQTVVFNFQLAYDIILFLYLFPSLPELKCGLRCSNAASCIA